MSASHTLYAFQTSTKVQQACMKNTKSASTLILDALSIRNACIDALDKTVVVALLLLGISSVGRPSIVVGRRTRTYAPRTVASVGKKAAAPRSAALLKLPLLQRNRERELCEPQVAHQI